MNDRNLDTTQRHIAELEERLADARARLPRHDPSPALMAEIDDLERELEGLRQVTTHPTIAEQVALLQARLVDAQARIPKHSTPPALMAEIDALEAELARLQSIPGGPQFRPQ